MKIRRFHNLLFGAVRTLAIMFGMLIFFYTASAQSNLGVKESIGNPQAVNSDFDGDGVSDFGILRIGSESQPNCGDRMLSNREWILGRSKRQFNGAAEDGKPGGVAGHSDPFGSPVPGFRYQWWINESGSSSVNVISFGGGGVDFYVPSDFDGDGKVDPTVWREDSSTGPEEGYFFILQSSDGTIRTEDFGIMGDNPSLVGDYDGDGKADPAVFRCPVSGQCSFYYKGSMGGGENTYIPWGNNSGGNIRPYPGDFDGDGKFDFVIARETPSGQLEFVILRSSDFAVEYVTWGLPGDLLHPGDYDGDGMTDLMNIRIEGGLGKWYLLERDGGGTGAAAITWGTRSLPAGVFDITSPGDFDGDGATDVAIWRRDNNNPGESRFWVRRSSDLMLEVFQFGGPGDLPINGWDFQ